MSIFKKLFGLPVKATSEKGRAPTKTVPLDTGRLAPRATVLPLRDLVFNHRATAQTRVVDGPIEVANISSTGIGFFKRASKEWPPVGTLLSGRLMIGREAHTVTIEVVHFSSTIVGCRFRDTDLKKPIEKYFDLELTALKAREIDPAIMREDPLGSARWFMADHNCELYFVEKDKHIVHFHLSVFGNYLEGGQGKPVLIKQIQEDDPNEDTGIRAYKGADLIALTGAPSDDVIRSAIRFIENIEKVPLEQRRMLQAFLDGASQASTPRYK